MLRIHARFHTGRCYLGRRLLRFCSSQPSVRVRFAPSPTGHLHLGGLRTALINYLFAKSHNGKFVLRIENTDQTRFVPGAMENMISSLEWAGIHIDEGPMQGGPYEPYIQSERLQLYEKAASDLLQSGAAYRCFCTSRRLEMLRREAVRRREVPKYDNRCRHLTEDEINTKLDENAPFVVRLKLEHRSEPWQDLVYGPISYDVAANEGDPILMKSDGFPTYHLANVVDDHHMNITHVLRGVEWQVSTAKHILLYAACGWAPPQFAHLPLLLNKDGKKLSKRQNDVHVETYKERGYMPEAVVSLLTASGSGFKVRDPTKLTMTQLIEEFDLTKLSTHSSKVDFDRLAEFNKYHIQMTLHDPSKGRQLLTQLRAQLSEAYPDIEFSAMSDDYLHRVLLWAQDRISLLSDLCLAEYKFLWQDPPISTTQTMLTDDIAHKLNITTSFIDTLPSEFTDHDTVLKLLKECCKENCWKFGSVMKVLRTALSGQKEGPSVAEMVSVLGKSTTLCRLHRATHTPQHNVSVKIK